MSIRVIDEQPVVKEILWSATKVGYVYRSGDLVAFRSSMTNSVEAFAVCLREGEGVRLGAIWTPGENSTWTPVNMDSTIAPVVDQ